MRSRPWGTPVPANGRRENMLSLTPKTQIDKARHALRDAVAYADEVVRDERLRADIRAAVGHGTKASDRLRKEIDARGISARLTSDAKLRKNLRAMLDDLDSAGQRMRRKKGHRARSVLLVSRQAESKRDE